MSEKYFLFCPRGFINERSIYATNDEKIALELSRVYDDGMSGTWEEITEVEAKNLIYKHNVEPEIRYARESGLKWESLKSALFESAEGWYSWQ